MESKMFCPYKSENSILTRAHRKTTKYIIYHYIDVIVPYIPFFDSERIEECIFIMMKLNAIRYQ